MKRRGSSLLELIMASALLLAAMTGLVQLMIHGSRNSRDGIESINASLQAQRLMGDLQATQFAGLNPGLNQDGGVILDANGRRYGVLYDVIDETLTLNNYPTYRVNVRVEYGRDLSDGGPKWMTFTTLVSRNPDGGV